MPDPLPELGFVTYQGAPALTDDDRLAVEPLQRLGYVVRPLVWDDASVHWERFAALILRSTWDYHKKAPAFTSWLDRIESRKCRLWNPAALVRWNMDKTYLRDLAERGVPVTPTAWIAEGGQADLATILRRAGWDRAVVKPTLSATAYQTWMVGSDTAEESQPRLDEMTGRGGVMVQRFEDSIIDGEWSLLFFAGQFSHAVLKVPTEGDFRVQKEYGGTSAPAQPPRRVIATAEQALSEVRSPWLYARVDLVDSESGVRLMELEMLEPDLFLRHEAGAAVRFAQAIHRVTR